MAASWLQMNFVRFGRRCYRFFNTGQSLRQGGNLKKVLAEEEEHAKGTLANWKKISMFIAAPTCLLIGYKTFFVDHEEHADPNAYVSYSHIHIRNKAFPWGDGDHSLFHNKKANFGFPEKSAEDEEEAPVKKKEHFITKFMVDYMIDDPEENRKKMNDHMALIRKRADEYLERKRQPQYPPEPIDLDEILEQTRRADELGVDGY